MISNTSEDQFRVEFECEFIGSMNTLINPSKLRTLAEGRAVMIDDSLTLYEYPQEDHTYCITVDTSRGVSIDYSAFQIIDVTKYPYKQVGKYKNNNISPMVYPNIINRVARNFNNALVLVEINDIGGQVVDILHNEFEYDNLLWTTNRGRAGQVLSAGFGDGSISKGVRTTKQVKRIGCSNLKDIIETDKLIIQDLDTIIELSQFVQKGDSYEAEQGTHDDLVMCLVLLAWCINQDYFKEVTDSDLRLELERKKQQEIDDQMLPFGFIDDGHPEEETWGSLI